MDLCKANLPTFLPRLKARRLPVQKEPLILYTSQPLLGKPKKLVREKLNFTVPCISMEAAPVHHKLGRSYHDLEKMMDRPCRQHKHNQSHCKLPPIANKQPSKKLSVPFLYHHKLTRSFSHIIDSPLSGWAAVETYA
mmetsp:Transcript_27856/g.50056  ORF Transcript_27856/g.50056 Transcript_27856/m.50056 type:complete len:137 (+) Transcript_27856:235-645(+)